MLRQLALVPIVTAAIAALVPGVRAAEPTGALKAIIEAANKEGTLNISYGQSVIGGSNGVQLIEKQLNSMFGTKIKINFVPGPSMMAQGQQLLLENSTGRKANSDVFIAPAPPLTALMERDVLAPVDWPGLLPDRIRPDLIEGQGKLLRYGVSFPVIAYNTQRAPMVPKSLADMMRPEWKGKIAAISYLLGFEILAADGVWGRDKAFDYVRRLSGQTSGLIRCGAELERVATGEYAAVVMDCIGGNTVTWQEKGAPVDYVIPSDAAQLHYYYLTVPKNASYPNAAKLFTVFMMTEAGQKLNWDTWKVDLDGLSGSRVAPRIAKLKQQGTGFTEVTYDWWVKHPEVPGRLNELLKIMEKK